MTRSIVHHHFTSCHAGWRCRGEECRRLKRAAENVDLEALSVTQNTHLRPRPPLICPCTYPWAPSNFGVKLPRPGAGPAAELPASSPA